MPPRMLRLGLAAIAGLAACARAPAPAPASPADVVPAAETAATPPVPYADEPIQPLPERIALDPARVALGRKLFHDPRLSQDGTVSCATCHPLDRGGADGLVHSIGAGGAATAVNTPTVFNVAFSFRYNWNGAYGSLEAEMEAPVRRAMATDWPQMVARLAADAGYRAAFAAIYPDGVTPANLRDALATFERSLITPNARFDRWLRGDASALGDEEREGYRLFKSYGCASCHQGANVGGNLFQRLGVLADYFADRGDETTADLGLYNATSDPADRHVFRVPSLRNVELTAPYFHDGSAATLEDAIDDMATYQLGRPLTAADRGRIAAFLRTLTGVREQP